MAVLISYTSCTHDPILIEDPGMPIDSTDMPGDTTDNPIDTMDMGIPCEDDVVYFNAQILPILKSNCAFSGCHDAASANDDVILESYNSVTGTADVQPFNLNDSEFYEVLVEDNPEKKMPPPPAKSLTTEQVSLIAQWILQGAEDLACDQDTMCVTNDMSFQNDVFPILETHCVGCHSGDSPSGGALLENYEGVKSAAEAGRIYGVISWSQGFVQMPQGQDQLDDCKVMKIKAWIDEGALDN